MSKSGKIPNEVVKMHVIDGYSLIKSWRLFQSKTLVECSKMMGVSEAQYSAIENQIPTKNQLEKLSEILNVPLELLTLDDS